MPAGLVSLEETKLDDRYSMARAKWQWRVERGGTAEEITLGSTVILQKTSEGLQIVLYLNHEDIVSVLRQSGLLPAGLGQYKCKLLVWLCSSAKSV